MSGRNLLVRLATAIACCCFGFVLGRVGAWLVWGFIYGIGERVITDELYAQLEVDVVHWGGIAGACSGFAVGCLPGILSGGGLMFVTFASVLLGIMGETLGWRLGLIGFFGAHLAIVIACVFLATTKSKWNRS